MNELSTRREMLAQSLTVAGAGAVIAGTHARAVDAADSDTGSKALPAVRYCLNTSTIMGQEISVEREIDLIAAAGYDGVEPWIREIRKFMDGGGKLADLRKRLDDQGIAVDSAIGFANWIVDDDELRKKGLERLKADMDLIRQLGGSRIAAPPAGATNKAIDPARAAERYRAALAVGAEMGVHPQLELWGFSRTLSRLGELMHIAIESGHAEAGVLLDIYHIYKGGSDFEGLNLINGAAIHVFHMNDYPADPPRETIRDADRVYPGDGVAPLRDVLRGLYKTGFRGTLSLELFNPDYWKQDAALVARAGLERMKAAVAASLK